jgi:uncharacterized glyoxalase superfamily protein PhnB
MPADRDFHSIDIPSGCRTMAKSKKSKAKKSKNAAKKTAKPKSMKGRNSKPVSSKGRATKPVSAASKGRPAKGPKHIPEGCHGVIPHLIVNDGNRAIEFYKRAFGAKEHLRMPGPDGRSIGHAHLEIGEGALYLCDESAAMNCHAPTSIGGTPVSMHLYVEDVDPAFARAVEAGATVTMPLMNMFWGDRFGKLRDPFGHEWTMASHVEDVSPAEMEERGKAAYAAMAKGPA